MIPSAKPSFSAGRVGEALVYLGNVLRTETSGIGSPGLRAGGRVPTSSGRGSLANGEIATPGGGRGYLAGSGTSVSTIPLFSLAFT